MNKNLGKVLTVLSISLLLPVAVFNFLLMKFLSVPLWKVLMFDIFYIVLVSVPVYAGITKGDKAHAQSLRKYMVKYIWFPLSFALMVFAFSALSIPAAFQAIVFVTALVLKFQSQIQNFNLKSRI